jgi:hypothetical protein
MEGKIWPNQTWFGYYFGTKTMPKLTPFTPCLTSTILAPMRTEKVTEGLAMSQPLDVKMNQYLNVCIKSA